LPMCLNVAPANRYSILLDVYIALIHS
jgi:hypothetical protein